MYASDFFRMPHRTGLLPMWGFGRAKFTLPYPDNVRLFCHLCNEGSLDKPQLSTITHSHDLVAQAHNYHTQSWSCYTAGSQLSHSVMILLYRIILSGFFSLLLLLFFFGSCCCYCHSIFGVNVWRINSSRVGKSRYALSK